MADFVSFFQTKSKQKRRGKTFLSANIYERNLTRDSFSLSIAYGDNVYMQAMAIKEQTYMVQQDYS